MIRTEDDRGLPTLKVPWPFNKASQRQVEKYQIFLARLGIQRADDQIALNYFLLQIYEQIKIVIPISLYFVLFLAVVFQRAVEGAGTVFFGIVAVLIGLVLFIEGLKFALMPLGEQVGKEMPLKLKLIWVLVIAFVLGVAVTYAEPAISSLTPLVSLVKVHRAPYLHYILMELREVLVLCIGLGVGLATVLGTLRFVKNWSLKPLIFATLTPTLIMALIMHIASEDLQSLIGLAWDCGAVTTGPVTVPIILAIGVGVTSQNKDASSALSGFGVVTLASVLPVTTVQLLALFTYLSVDRDHIIANSDGTVVEESAWEKSPVREVVFGLRAIMPLTLFLFFILKVVLRSPIPSTKLLEVIRANNTSDEPDPPKSNSDMDPTDAHSEITEATSNGTAPSPMITVKVPTGDGDIERQENGHNASEMVELESSDDGESSANEIKMEIESDMENPVRLSTDSDYGYHMNRMPSRRASSPSMFDEELGSKQEAKRCIDSALSVLLMGLAFTQVGIIVFNIGLTYGLAGLGSKVGSILPAAFEEVPGVENSPRFEYHAGLFIVYVFTFVLGVLATLAEPALNVMGLKVEQLTKGQFTRRLLISAVALGVGFGTLLGLILIIFQLPLIYFLLGGYTIACGLTIFANQDFVSIAWDSAGVTTGPVTVPFVLSLGLSFGKVVDAPQGFGILACASVAPIIAGTYII
jgi:hypothetical protein